MLLTACSGSDEPTANDGPKATESTGAPASAATPTVLPNLNATQVVSALSGAGYECTTDVAYAICRMGAAAVWVLTGDHPRPPVVSVHALGPVDVAWAEISNSLARILELAHVNQGAEIAAWFEQQKNKPVAQQTFGDWQADYSAEVDTDEPGVHLTLTDKLCTTKCQAE